MDDSYERSMRPWYESDPPETTVPAVPRGDSAMPAYENAHRLAVAAHDLAQAELKTALLSHIYCQSHQFFEMLMIDLLVAMGYAGRRRDLATHLGKSHDGGVDGLIAQDELALEAIYLQAKRLKLGSTVPVTDIRNFVGRLEAKKASKGVFITTGQFTQPAEQFINDVHRRVVLINGDRLAGLMVRHNVGVTLRHTYQAKMLDKAYFSRG